MAWRGSPAAGMYRGQPCIATSRHRLCPNAGLAPWVPATTPPCWSTSRRPSPKAVSPARATARSGPVCAFPASAARPDGWLHPDAEGKLLVGAPVRDHRGVAPGAARFRRLVQYPLAGRPPWPQDACQDQGRPATDHGSGRMNDAAACLTTLVQYSGCPEELIISLWNVTLTPFLTGFTW